MRKVQIIKGDYALHDLLEMFGDNEIKDYIIANTDIGEELIDDIDAYEHIMDNYYTLSSLEKHILIEHLLTEHDQKIYKAIKTETMADVEKFEIVEQLFKAKSLQELQGML